MRGSGRRSAPREPSFPSSLSDPIMTKPLLRPFRGERAWPPPVWMMRQAGRYLAEYRELRKQAKSFLDFCYTPDLAVEATLQPIRRYGFDGAILFSDILVVPDALGRSVVFREGEGPRLEPIADGSDIDRLDTSRVTEHLKPVYEAVGRIKQSLSPETAMIGFAGAPWTVAVYMVEGRGGTEAETARRWAYADPETFGRLIDVLVDATAAHIRNQIAAGAEVVQIFDSWSGVLSAAQFRSLVIEPTKRLVARIKADHPDVPVIGFPRNSGPSAETYFRETGVDGLSIDHGLPLAWVREHLQSTGVVQGNLDNQVLVSGGDALDAAVDDILAGLGQGPFVFNLGHGVVPQTPPENVARVVERIRKAPETAG